MSGLAGIVNRDDSPVDELIVRQMTDFQAFRGPDAQTVWVGGQAGLSHTLFRTTPDEIDERQPCTLDGRTWITADARLDDREGLRRRLAERDLSCAETAADAKLILAAYRVWGEQCLDHLAGDFSFAIWDQEKRRLFCARDQFGVRPFFYAQTPESLVFSNSLACLRLHPDVSSELDEPFMGDWFLQGRGGEPDATAFKGQRRLPAAHFLTWGTNGLHVQRYWSLPTEHPVLRFRQPHEYVEEFRRLLRLALRDRLRTPRAAVFMSGGLDSTLVAAAAHGYLKEAFGQIDLHAHVMTYERIIDDKERIWAPRAADGIGIPLHAMPFDEYRVFPGWPGASDEDSGSNHEPAGNWVLPEPTDYPIMHAIQDFHRQIATTARVALTGHGGDPGLAWPPKYFLDLFWRGQWPRVFKEIASFRWHQGRRPPLGLRALMSSWRRQPPVHGFPDWLNEDFAARLHLRERYETLNQDLPMGHATHAMAHASASSSVWSIIFEQVDAGFTGVPLDVTHPFFDLRIYGYFLSIPPFPWCIDKLLFREAAKGLLPESIRLRPKTTFPGEPPIVALQQLDPCKLARYTLPETVDPFVRRRAVPGLAEICGPRGTREIQPWTDLRPYCLAHWVQQQTAPLIISKGTAT